MGFYAPAQIVRDAKEHGVEVRAPDVNYSDWDNLLAPAAEPGRYALRLGFRQVDGLHADAAARIVSARTRPSESIEELKRRSGANVTAIERLAAPDPFPSHRKGVVSGQRGAVHVGPGWAVHLTQKK